MVPTRVLLQLVKKEKKSSQKYFKETDSDLAIRLLIGIGNTGPVCVLGQIKKKQRKANLASYTATICTGRGSTHAWLRLLFKRLMILSSSV